MFRCKQFDVHQDICAMKVNTDSLVLGSWVELGNSHTILDIGTGTGILALMMAQKSQHKFQHRLQHQFQQQPKGQAHITAIDIDTNAAKQASQNAALSRWSNRISVQQCNLSEFQPKDCFDLIITNPPYFEQVNGVSQAYRCQSSQRELARQTVSLTPLMLFSFVKKHLNHQGRFYCLYPYSRESDIIETAQKHHLAVHRLLRVQHDETRDPYLSVFCFAKGHCQVEVENLIIRNDDGAYTKAFISLCRDFYLRF